VAFDTILNSVWLLLGLFALALIIARVPKGRSRALCCIGVGLIIATLFPVISATDDVIRIEHLEHAHRSHRDHQTSSNRQALNDTLIRLYEAMDSPLAATPVQISFVLVFAFLLLLLCEAYARKLTIATNGRSPPVCTA